MKILKFTIHFVRSEKFAALALALVLSQESYARIPARTSKRFERSSPVQ